MSRMSAGDDAFAGERWAEALQWIDRQVQASALAHPEIPAENLAAMAASAYGYATAPEYPSDDRDEIFGQMLRPAPYADAEEAP
jgi:hypothetical protein